MLFINAKITALSCILNKDDNLFINQGAEPKKPIITNTGSWLVLLF
jgi:hypothetical protein